MRVFLIMSTLGFLFGICLEYADSTFGKSYVSDIVNPYLQPIEKMMKDINS